MGCLELHQDDVSICLADVLANMGLSGKKEHITGLEMQCSGRSIWKGETPVEDAERIQDGVGVVVLGRFRPRLVSVVQDPRAFVFENDLVFVWIRDSWILGEEERTNQRNKDREEESVTHGSPPKKGLPDGNVGCRTKQLISPAPAPRR